jgi:integrase
MRGSIRKRGSTYTYWLDVGPDPATGKRRQRTKGGFRTKRECQVALNEAIAAVQGGTFVEPSKRTVRSFLLEEWLPAVQVANLRPRDLGELPHSRPGAHRPCLGTVELQRLSPAQLNAFYRYLLSEAGKDGQGLAPKTVRNVHNILHRALKDAVRWGYLIRNVAEAADPPKGKSAEMRVWSPDQLRAFLEHVRQDHLYAFWLLVATTGMRRGELAGLRWADVDLEAGRLSVRQPRVVVGNQPQSSEPKTARGRRSLALDPVTVSGLRRHRARQLEQKLAVGARYQDSGLVFTWLDGSPIHPLRFSRWFEQHAHRAGLPKIRLHDLRHSYASAALAAGVPAKVISERLGHATIAVTMDIYSHVLPGLDRDAADTVARLILGGGGVSEASVNKPLASGHRGEGDQDG